MKYISLISLVIICLSAQAWAQEPVATVEEDPIELDDGDDFGDDLLDDADELDETLSLDAEIEALKKEVLSLNRDLFILEEDLLYPSNTQFSIFLSMDAGALFSLDSVQLKIDDNNISNHLYTERELGALKRGGVQRLYIGNLPSGEHEIVAIFTGVGPKGRDYRRGESIVVEKTSEPQFVEFMIADDTGKEQPQFEVRVWE